MALGALEKDRGRHELAQAVGSRSGRRPSTSHAELERIAFELFDERGFDDTLIDDIAEAAGIGRRTFFRYYPSKTDLVWGDFSGGLALMAAHLDAVDPDVPLLVAVRLAVVDFNRLPADQEQQHRRRMSLILGVPTLLANSTLRFAQWRSVIATYAATRTGAEPDDLLPKVLGHCALGASLAAYDSWLQKPGSDLSQLLTESMTAIESGFTAPAPRRRGLLARVSR